MSRLTKTSVICYIRSKVSQYFKKHYQTNWQQKYMNENVWEIITEALGVFWDENRSAARCFEIFGENRKWNEAYFTCVAFSETLVQDLPKRSSKSLEKSSTEESSQFAQEMIRVQKKMFFSSFFFKWEQEFWIVWNISVGIDPRQRPRNLSFH